MGEELMQLRMAGLPAGFCFSWGIKGGGHIGLPFGEKKWNLYNICREWPFSRGGGGCESSNKWKKEKNN